MTSWTVEAIVKLGPCYSEARIREVYAGRATLTLREILALDIPAADRLWVVWRPRVLTPAQRQTVCDRIVERAIRSYALGEPTTKVWATRWLDGTDRSRAAAAGAARAAGAAARAHRAAPAVRAARARTMEVEVEEEARRSTATTAARAARARTGSRSSSRFSNGQKFTKEEKVMGKKKNKPAKVKKPKKAKKSHGPSREVRERLNDKGE